MSLLMAQDVRLLTEALGGSALSQLVQRGEAPKGWVAERPATAEAWRSHVDAVRTSFGAGWWSAIEPACAPSGAAADRMRNVVANGGVVVTTGQQPGLFGGPAYTWFKALTALAFADAVEAATGIPAAPVFWAATDDSDWLEASWTAVATTGGAQRLALTNRPPDDGVRLADVPLGDVSALLAALEEACGSVLDQRPLEAVRRTYVPTATIGSAYVALLRELLEPLGIVVLDAAHPAMGQAAHALLVRALTRDGAIAEALAARSEAIRAAGLEPQVIEVEGRTLVFARVQGKRERVASARAGEVAARAAPGTLSPNVLLRPIVERVLLPTVAYMAGPGELAYFAQVSAVAEALDVPSPLALPRWSATIVEPSIATLLEAHGLTPADFADPHAVESRFARAAWPPPVSREYARLREALQERLASLREAIESTNAPVPPSVLDGVGRELEWRLRRLERRITAGMKRRETRLLTELATLRGALYPFGARQERVLNLVPVLSRHGLDLLERLRDEAGHHARALIGATARASAP
ncbi:MAG TPA: bacillithiol biosynthesis BshC [Gemmatimonadaceae bacterium]